LTPGLNNESRSSSTKIHEFKNKNLLAYTIARNKNNIIPINWGKRINSTGGGSVAEYSLYKFVISAGFKALRESIEDKA
jgi:hypothetical protein